MLGSLSGLYDYTIEAKEGDLGTVQDFFFDDREWVVRYLVVDTGKWLPGRRVLISPASIDRVSGADRHLRVNLTKEQVENSPEVDTDKPVSRQMEAKLVDYYSWPVYWGPPGRPLVQADGGVLVGPQGGVAVPVEGAPPKAESSGDPHLRSARTVTGYYIEATNGSIGHVEDYLVEDETWTLRYLVIDTRNWLPGRKVIVAPQWSKSIDWEESKVFLTMSRDAVKNSPEYNPSTPLSPKDEERLQEYYRNPRFWQ